MSSRGSGACLALHGEVLLHWTLQREAGAEMVRGIRAERELHIGNQQRPLRNQATDALLVLQPGDGANASPAAPAASDTVEHFLYSDSEG